jgi:hypothetical protein
MKGEMFDTILLASEYAPNSSGPNPLARNRVTNIIDTIAAIDVIVVETISLRNGLRLILRKLCKISVLTF